MAETLNFIRFIRLPCHVQKKLFAISLFPTVWGYFVSTKRRSLSKNTPINNRLERDSPAGRTIISSAHVSVLTPKIHDGGEMVHSCAFPVVTSPLTRPDILLYRVLKVNKGEINSRICNDKIKEGGMNSKRFVTNQCLKYCLTSFGKDEVSLKRD